MRGTQSSVTTAPSKVYVNLLWLWAWMFMSTRPDDSQEMRIHMKSAPLKEYEQFERRIYDSALKDYRRIRFFTSV